MRIANRFPIRKLGNDGLFDHYFTFNHTQSIKQMEFPESYLHVDISKQQLTFFNKGKSSKTYLVSTAKNGVGEAMGSECTPTGWHKIRAKIGESQPINSVFVGRRPTGEIYTPALNEEYPQRDWILSRIIWLGGLEAGKNRYGSVDSTWRYIYIHGCPDELMKGTPESHGCIRMKNKDIVDLFNNVTIGLNILIDS